jgi:hypothetical protein
MICSQSSHTQLRAPWAAIKNRSAAPAGRGATHVELLSNYLPILGTVIALSLIYCFSIKNQRSDAIRPHRRWASSAEHTSIALRRKGDHPLGGLEGFLPEILRRHPIDPAEAYEAKITCSGTFNTTARRHGSETLSLRVETIGARKPAERKVIS